MAFLWLLGQPDARRFWSCVVAESLILATVVWATNGSSVLVVVGAVYKSADDGKDVAV